MTLLKMKIDAALESFRLYRSRSRGDAHDIVQGVALRVEVVSENSVLDAAASHRRIVATLQRGLKLRLGTSPLSSLNQFSGDIDRICKLLLAPPDSAAASVSTQAQSRLSSPLSRSPAPLELLELDAPPPIFGSPVRRRPTAPNQLQHDESPRKLSFADVGCEGKSGGGEIIDFFDTNPAAATAAFCACSQFDLVLSGGGNGESVVEIEFINSNSNVSGGTGSPFGNLAVGVVRMHLVAHCPGGEPFARLSSSPLPWHAINISLVLPPPAFSPSIFALSLSNFAFRCDCASAPGISSLCPVTLFQLALYSVPRSNVSSSHTEPSSTEVPTRKSAALRIGAVSVDCSSSVELWSATTAALSSVTAGCSDSSHHCRILSIINRTGSPLYFFDVDRQRIDSGCFKLFDGVEASSTVEFFLADVADTSFVPPLLLLQTERYYCTACTAGGRTLAAVVDVVIDAAEARVTCTISSCITVTNHLPQSLCAIALSDSGAAARLLCEIPPCASAEGGCPYYLPLHELPLPADVTVRRQHLQCERVVLVPASVWQANTGISGLVSSTSSGFEWVTRTEAVCSNNFDIIEIYSSMLLLESRDDGTQPAKPAPSWARWSMGRGDAVHAHVASIVSQRVHAHHSSHRSSMSHASTSGDIRS